MSLTRVGAMPVGASEWESVLVRNRAREADAEFAALVDRQSRFAFRIAFAVLRNVADAEEAVQEMFFKLFRSGAWKDMRDERAFLARTVWRIAVDKRPARKAYEIEAGELASGSPNPERTAIENERERAIHRLIDSLPEKMRRPLVLFSTAEMTTLEIAELLQIPEGTVRRLLTEARALLKEKLARWEARKNA